jgi:IclR family KDG regulon transcriptional repressor
MEVQYLRGVSAADRFCPGLPPPVPRRAAGIAPPQDQEAIFRLLVPIRYMATTTRSLRLLRLALKTIHKNGYVYSDQEREEGVRAIAAPIFVRGEGRYCVTMSGPLFRITTEKIPLTIETVRKTASAITERVKTIEY